MLWALIMYHSSVFQMAKRFNADLRLHFSLLFLCRKSYKNIEKPIDALIKACYYYVKKMKENLNDKKEKLHRTLTFLYYIRSKTGSLLDQITVFEYTSPEGRKTYR